MNVALAVDGEMLTATCDLGGAVGHRGDFSWNAVTTFAGDDADQCPAGGVATFML